MNLLPLPFLDRLVAIRRDLHAHPELAFQETRTADVIANELAACGLEVHRGLAGTGIVGVLRKGSGGRSVGLRADMDALPLSEKNVFSHCSTRPGRMHACGHDGHTTMLLGAALFMAENRDALDFEGTVHFIFQPAEETDGGADVMIRDGLFDRFPMDAVFGLHNWPGVPVGELAVMPGPVMAGTCSFEIAINGQGCHAAMPQQGLDPLVAASHLVLALQTIVSRNVDPCEAAVVSVTQIHGGESFNVIPDDAVVRGTIRAFNPEVQALVEASLHRICAGIDNTFGVHSQVSFAQRYPPTINSAAESALCGDVGAQVFGAANVRRNELPSTGAEDFAFMLQKKPGCYVWLGNGPGSGGCTLHNPHYDFNDAIIPLGVTYWVRLAESYLHR